MDNRERIDQAFHLIQRGDLVGAKAICLFLIKSQEAIIDAQFLLGVIAFKEHRFGEATQQVKIAVEARPKIAEYWKVLGDILKADNKEGDAISAYRQGFSINNSNIQLGMNLARALRFNSGESEALEVIGKLSAHYDADTFAPMLACWQLSYIPNSATNMATFRQNYEQAVNRLSTINGSIDESLLLFFPTNFLAVYQGKDDRKYQEAIANFYLRTCPTLSYQAPHLDVMQTGKTGNAKIKIGFLSTNFRNHTVGRLFCGIIAELDRKVFEVAVFGGKAEDEIGLFIEEHSDQFYHLPNNLSEARELVARTRLDILVYPDIGMSPLTYFLAFSRLAQVQCVGWGHPVTTGLPSIDYFLSSLHLEEQEIDDAQSHYTEKLHRLTLPPTYLYPCQTPALNDIPDLSFAKGKTRYVCPQALFKVHPDFDDLLVSVLQKDPSGIAIFIEGQAGWSENLRARWRAIDSEIDNRVYFLPRQNQIGFLALCKAADVILDTIFFCGGISSVEALSQKTPIITWPNSPILCSRVTTAYYEEIGVMDCVAHSAEEYVDIAVRLGTDAAWRNTIETRISENSHLLFKRQEVLEELSAFFQSVS